MPEGDTVHLAGKRLRAALSGHQLIRGELRHPRLVQHDLAGRTVLDVVSVGKHLFTRFDDGRSLHSHFRMDGSWHLYRPNMSWQRPAYEARAVLATADRVAVGFALHDLELLPTGRGAPAGRAPRARTCSTRTGTTGTPPRRCAGSPPAPTTSSGWCCSNSG